MTYRYRILSKSEDHRREMDERGCREMDLAYIAAEIAAMKCAIKTPTIRFIVECGNGCITRDQRIDGYSHNHKEIFIRSGMPPARTVEIAVHETRHCQQWSKGWANRSDQHCEADAETFVRELWGTRRVKTDPEKILLQLYEIGAPLAAAAGNFQPMTFYLGELRIAGHPAAAKLDKECTELCRQRERAESPRKNVTVTNLPATSDKRGSQDPRVRAVRDHYYNVILPARAAAYIKPHLQASCIEYAIGEYRDERKKHYRE